MGGIVLVFNDRLCNPSRRSSHRFLEKVHAINFGVYGATMVGKTTLSNQLRTRGEVPQITERTVGRHRASRKSIKIDGESHTIRSADIGGEAIYWKEWEKDMKTRRPKYVIFMIDHRHLDNNSNLDHQVAWKFLVDTIISPRWSDGKKEKRFRLSACNRYLG